MSWGEGEGYAVIDRKGKCTAIDRALSISAGAEP